MKKLLLVTLALASCASQVTYIPRESLYYGIDFTKYTREGFLITPEKYDGEYESIGIVRYVIVPGARLVATKTSRSTTSEVYEEEKRWIAETVKLSQGVDSLHAMARRMGADAIINFNSTVATREYPGLRPLTLSGFDISGYAIRRAAK